MKPLIWKEFRENVRWMPIGLLVSAAVCWMVHPRYQGNNSLLAIALVNQFAIITPLLAFALGVVQAYRDLQNAAGAYLNHRGVTASDVFLAKTISGFAIYIVSVIVPLAGLAAWVAYHGMWWFPMRPAQVIPAFVFALAAFAMHPAATLMMSRSASWWGTRLFPLAPAAAMLAVFYAYLRDGGLLWAGISFLVGLLMLAWMIAIARQSWRQLASDPPAATVNASLRRRWLLPTYMLVGSVVCLTTAVMFAIAFVEDLSRSKVYVPTPTSTLAIEEGTDKVWLVTHQQDYDSSIGNYSDKVLGGEIVTGAATELNVMANDAKNRKFRYLNYVTQLRSMYYNSDGFFTQPNASQGRSLNYAYDARGYLIGYEQYPQLRWVTTIAADGVHPAGVLAGKPFKLDALGNGYQIFMTLANFGFPHPLIDADGVYVIDQDPIAIRKIIDLPIDGVSNVEAGEGLAPRLIIRSENQLSEFQLVDETGTDDWFETQRSNSMTRTQKIPNNIKLSAELVRTVTLPDAGFTKGAFGIAWTADAIVVSKNWIDQQSSQSNDFYRLKADAPIEKVTFAIDPGTSVAPDFDKFTLTTMLVGMIPGGLDLTGFAIALAIYITDPSQPNPVVDFIRYPIMVSTFFVSFIIITALSFWLVRRAAYRRGLSRQQTRCWNWSVPFLGLAAPLSIIAIYRLVHREPCPACTAPRRVDLHECEHCGEPWQPPADQGIEIIDQAA